MDGGPVYEDAAGMAEDVAEGGRNGGVAVVKLGEALAERATARGYSEGDSQAAAERAASIVPYNAADDAKPAVSELERVHTIEAGIEGAARSAGALAGRSRYIALAEKEFKLAWDRGVGEEKAIAERLRAAGASVRKKERSAQASAPASGASQPAGGVAPAGPAKEAAQIGAQQAPAAQSGSAAALQSQAQATSGGVAEQAAQAPETGRGGTGAAPEADADAAAREMKLVVAGRVQPAAAAAPEMPVAKEGAVLPSLSLPDQITELEKIGEGLDANVFNSEQLKVIRMELGALEESAGSGGSAGGGLDALREQRMSEVKRRLAEHGG